MARQIAALPILRAPGGGVEVFLVTSRGSGRWIIPKGNPIRGLSPDEVAAREALEEAGLVGRVLRRRVGTFAFKRGRRSSEEPCLVDVYVMHVEKQLRRFDEKGERKILRCDIATACAIVGCPALGALIETYSVRVR